MTSILSIVREVQRETAAKPIDRPISRPRYPGVRGRSREGEVEGESSRSLFRLELCRVLFQPLAQGGFKDLRRLETKGLRVFVCPEPFKHVHGHSHVDLFGREVLFLLRHGGKG